MFWSESHTRSANALPQAPRQERARSRLATLLALGLAACASFGVASPAPAQQGQPGYVDTTALNLRVDAGTRSAIVGILLKYDVVTVFGRKRIGATTWYEIEASGGYTNGYVHSRYIQFGAVPAGASEREVLDYGAQETPTLARGAFQYIGPRACAECHDESTGEYPQGASNVWSHTVHASSYQTLRKDYTIAIAKRKRDIADPINDWRCVKCHVTAYGADPSQLGPGYSHENGVSCEVCHGPGGGYSDADHGPGNPDRAALGFRILTDLTERREVCTSCHNTTSPTYKPFNLREFSRSIAHWVDPGDKFYYRDAVSEANRRQRRVDARIAAKAAEMVAADAAANVGLAKQEAARAEQRDEERKSREAAAARANAAERARLAKEQEEADVRAAAQAAESAKRELAARNEAQRRIEEADRQARAREREAAEAALVAEAAATAAKEREAASARQRAEQQALSVTTQATGVESYLEDIDEVLTLNTRGEKYRTVKFPHLAHASKKYLPEGSCSDCHHTHKGDDAPEPCSTCHKIGGNAEEDKAKTRAMHTKNKGYPRVGDQEQTSCVGCHKSMNALLEAGRREGEHAPTKCTTCHKRNR